jgi:hypothetical protein
MQLQYAITVCHDLLGSMLEIFTRLPAPATGVLLIAAGVCIYESLGNSRLVPGGWR